MCVTSPPYWGLRSYLPAGHPDKSREIGQEKTPELYVAAICEVMREVWRVLKDDGTLWLNLSDTLFKKNLTGIPWRVAFALQSAGWYLRQDIIWVKPNAMPESVTDRCTRSHEYIFMFSKQPRYYYDAEAIKEPMSVSSIKRLSQNIEDQTGSTRANGGAKTNGNMKAVGRLDKQRGHSRRHAGFNDRWDQMERDEQCSGMRNKRDVWSISPKGCKGAHFAVFPPELITPCILAGSEPCDTVLDPFGGSGTTGMVCNQLLRNAILCEINADYLPLISDRTSVV